MTPIITHLSPFSQLFFAGCPGCDEDTSASLYLKNGGYFGIFPYEEINVKEMPKQAEVAAIIYSDSCGFNVWAEDFNQIHFFVTYDANGLIDSYRIEYGDGPIYDGEVEISFEDLYERAEEDWRETYRAELPGTVEYQFKQEADKLAQEAGETWMDGEQREQFRQVCHKIDRIKSARDFKCTMPLLGYDFDKKIINAARKFKKCHTAAQYETERETAARVAQEAREVAENQPAAPSWMNKAQQEDFREICGMIDSIKSGRDFYRVMNLINGGRYSVDVINAAREIKQCFNSAQYEPQQDTPDAAEADNQQEAGTAAEAASKGQETALGTPETMAGTDATEAAGGQQAAPQAGEINLGKQYAETRPETGNRDAGKQPGGP